LSWTAGWIFVAILVGGFAASALVIAKVNPIIYRARSRFQPGTKGWDRALLAVILPERMAALPVAALDAGRFHASNLPLWVVILGYIALLRGICVTAWHKA